MHKRIFAFITILSLVSISPALTAKEWSWAEWASQGVNEALKRAEVYRQQAKELIEKAEESLQKSIQAIKEEFAKPELVGQYSEKTKMYMISVELPGYDSKNIEVEIHPNNVVTIEAFKQVTKEEKTDRGIIIKEVSKEAFRKAFQIPQEIIITDMAKIKAEYKKGILHVSIPAKKVKEEKKDASVKVKVTTK